MVIAVAERANTPWRGKSIKVAPSVNSRNADKQRRALSRMSLLERETGMTREQYDSLHREQRERVLARYGLAPQTSVAPSLGDAAHAPTAASLGERRGRRPSLVEAEGVLRQPPGTREAGVQTGDVGLQHDPQGAA